MIDTFFNLIDVVTVSNVYVMSGKVITVITPLMGSLVALYALYLGYQSFFDQQNLAVMESLRFIFGLGFITTVALSTPFYLGNIVPIVLGAGDDFVNALLTPPVTSTAGAIQVMINKFTMQVNLLWGTIDISITSGDTIVHAALVIFQIAALTIGFIPFIAISACYLVVAKIMISFLMIVGPLFIMMAYFPSTRDFFKSWSAQCFNYFLLSVLFPLAFALFGEVLDLTVFAGNVTYAKIYSSLVIFIILSFVAVQIPTLASSLSGGIGINSVVGNVAASMGSLSRVITGRSTSKVSSPISPKSGNRFRAG